MTTQEMNVGKRYALQNQYYYKETLSVAGNGDAILIPCGDINFVAHDLQGDGKIQVTVSPVEDIINDIAIWVDVVEDSLINPADTAVRQVNSTGTTILNLRCQ